MKTKLPHLKSLLQYENEYVIKRYMHDFKKSKAYSKKTFKELLKFLWLARRAHSRKDRVACSMYEGMIDVDNMWHTFIIFTEDYTSFCKKYFGEYLHHRPNNNSSRKATKKEKDDLGEFLSYVYDNLGEETMLAWFKVKD